MAYMICIDTGTTNTRVRLLDEKGEVRDTFFAAVGVRDTAIEGSNARLKKELHDGILALLEKEGITEADVSRVLASGMITSDMGLYELPHITAPADAAKLREKAATVTIPEVTCLPITFIPGVKNKVEDFSGTGFERMDIMRGEETETIAILEDLPKGQDYLIVLPGSHMKFVTVNAEGEITGCLTTLSGELMEAVTENTLIAGTVGKKFADSYVKEEFLKGYHVAEKVGITRGIFSTRIAGQFATKDRNALANYLMGVILQGDITAIKNSAAISAGEDTRVLVAGKEPLKQAMIDAFRECGQFKSVEGLKMPLEREQSMSARGAWLLFREA